ncbi:ribose-phosphate diphosphokinase [Acholeplasma equifetale]|uniref:ribose-phosphate diphosphokinase n=1 Tax=Acholeplasma equifetale TaxID=264634 RepID=UPI0004795759|nr:ribose-phosphate pyrophosphokinase [Acholeplasma equifetale]
MVTDLKKVKLFALSANRPLAESISKTAKIPLSNVEVVRFADGEITVNLEESVRGNHVFVVQPTSEPANDHLMEVLVLTDALKRASAASITIIMPYYGYSRQDRKVKSRQPITAKLVANLLQVAGVNRVVCIDLHAAQIQGFFDIPIDNFPGAPLLASYFKKKKLDNVVVVSPDHGGVSRARVFATYFDAPLAIIDKRRPKPNEAEVMNIIGDVKDATCIMIDDIVDTGGTLIAGANALLKMGAKEVYAAATHGVLTKQATDRIQDSVLKELVITDTINLKEEKRRPKIKQLSIGPLLGEAILHILNDEPISQIFTRIVEDI